MSVLVALAAGAVLGAALVGVWTRSSSDLTALADALGRIRDGDTSVRVRPTASGPIRAAIDELNRLAEGLGAERDAAYQQQLLLTTVIEQAPQTILLVDDEGRIRIANSTARSLLSGGEPLVGRLLDAAVERCPPPLRDVLRAPDGLHVVMMEEEPETLHLTRHPIRVRERPHVLWTLRRLGVDLARQEADAWKRAVRVMSHELNNSLAPVSSMVHSGRLIASRPQLTHRLEEVFAGIEARVSHLHAFLERYGRFARLPAPRPMFASWEDLLSRVGEAIPFGLAAPVPTSPAWVDPAQFEQVMINLLRNARESGSTPESILVRVSSSATHHILEVLDRGCGMRPEQLERALLPFYSTKPRGSGVGLALSREILEAHGGTLRISLDFARAKSRV